MVAGGRSGPDRVRAPRRSRPPGRPVRLVLGPDQLVAGTMAGRIPRRQERGPDPLEPIAPVETLTEEPGLGA